MSLARRAGARLVDRSHITYLATRKPRPGSLGAQCRHFADSVSNDKASSTSSQSSTTSNVSPAPQSGEKQSATSLPARTQPLPVAKPPDASPRLPVSSRSTPSSTSPSSIPPRAGATVTSNSSPPKPATPTRSRVTRYFFLPLALLGLSYALGVYLSLVSDNFHDFFTENIPFGEDAVLYFEEREFRRRFGDRATSSYKLHPQTSGERKVTVSGKSGVSAQVSSSNKDEKTSNKSAQSKEVQSAVAGKSSAKSDAQVTSSSKAAPQSKKPSSSAGAASAPIAAASQQTSSAETAPAQFTIPPIELLKLENALDPVTQEVTKMLNDIITTINADNDAAKYVSTITKARENLEQLSHDIAEFRSNASKIAEKQISQAQAEYKDALHALEERSNHTQQEQELRWREEYESERQRLSDNFEHKLDAEIQSAQAVAEQRLRNELLEQQVQLNNAFSDAVREQVESERGGRLAKLNDLSASVSKLDSLTASWGNVVEANVKTQHFLVAVEALRSVTESAEKSRPFLYEMAALKEIASDNKLVSATLSSITPATYQNGLPSSSDIVDRFRRVAAEVRKAALLPEHAGAASHAASYFLSKLMFKKEGLALGDDVESILSRAETLLEEGNLDEAAREMNGLEGWARVLSKDWLVECRRVLEARQALDILATEARLQSLTVI